MLVLVHRDDRALFELQVCGHEPISPQHAAGHLRIERLGLQLQQARVDHGLHDATSLRFPGSAVGFVGGPGLPAQAGLVDAAKSQPKPKWTRSNRGCARWCAWRWSTPAVWPSVRM